MEEWKEYKLGDISTMKYGKLPPSPSEEGKYPIWSGYRYVGMADSFNCFKGTMVVVARGVGGTGDVKIAKEDCYLTNLSISVDVNTKVCNPYYLHYKYSIKNLRYLDSGSAQSQITIDALKNLVIEIPPLAYQNKIVDVLKSLDDKIEVNRRINDNFYFAFFEVMLIWLLTSLRNDNLEQQAMALFDMMFPGVASGEDIIGNIIIPKRGKGLLSKDAVEGTVPVVAGGLEPATYHNESNTVAPVVTISASGANAGFVNLWQIPVWSSDSSFIDASMTENVYFWYVMLKKRQKEIFDAQTGSAQPHIYPKHIAEMPMGNFEQSDVEKFTEIATPMFEIRGRNLKECERLASLRDTLLPKLMSGELKLNEVNV